MKEQVKKQLRELDQKQQEFVKRIGEARDLLAELMFTSDAFFTLQKRELIHNLSCGCDHEDQYTKEGIIFCNDCGASLGFVEEDVHEPQFNYNLERMKEAVESPTIKMPDNIKTAEELNEWLNSASFDLVDAHPPKKFNYCPHNDAGFCYAKDDVVTNAINGGCFKPQECPANQG